MSILILKILKLAQKSILEFDVIGKYISRLNSIMKAKNANLHWRFFMFYLSKYNHRCKRKSSSNSHQNIKRII